MKVTVVADYDEMSTKAADIVAETIAANPTCTLCLPTGNTPLGMFKNLIERIASGRLDASQAHFFLLDEYVGIDADDPESLTGWLRKSFFEPAGIADDHIHELPAQAADLAESARHYEAELAARGGFELAVLGLGSNGHLAYNEPGSPGDSRTRVLTLTDESIEHARGYFEGRTVPTQAITAGIGTLLEARKIVVLVSGEAKAEILKDALFGTETPEVPASFLQRVSDRVQIIADRPATSLFPV